ncbi:hypothetical protein BLNAU_3724 [Blattamonas nauphoetae]|uniref:Dynein light chain n=1 Tax=Blattamonas nauphoetae TaxID=2049346 RepID=A0ABQ9YBY3_9EUKA|nr:hypothetical protein BLNAU_3724 [Blattamonas nauphoetae]
MQNDYLDGLKALQKELYDRVLLQSKDQYLNKGFDRLIAKFFKEGMDARFQQAWHCVVGPDFASYITHEAGSLCYFTIQYCPPPKRTTSTQQKSENEFEKKKDAQPIAFWKVLLWKAG